MLSYEATLASTGQLPRQNSVFERFVWHLQGPLKSSIYLKPERVKPDPLPGVAYIPLEEYTPA
jgi:hypothetical protein